MFQIKKGAYRRVKNFTARQAPILSFKTYIKAKMNVFFHFQNSKYPILPVEHLIFDNWHFDKKLEPTGQWTAR